MFSTSNVYQFSQFFKIRFLSETQKKKHSKNQENVFSRYLNVHTALEHTIGPVLS